MFESDNIHIQCQNPLCENTFSISAVKLEKEDLPDGHAADVETAAMLAINSSLVNMNKADRVVMSSLGGSKIKFNKSTSAILKDYPVDLTTIADFKQFTKSGVIGSSLAATKEKGEIVLDKVSDFLAELIRELKKV